MICNAEYHMSLITSVDSQCSVVNVNICHLVKMTSMKTKKYIGYCVRS